eukprot:gene11901-2463_t
MTLEIVQSGSLTAFPSNLPIRLCRCTLDKSLRLFSILGPWHSDSGLDRNVDPMEDSYVKKIISTNEGLNFNKDMAEAGEVFDVNGIEDFYDRNALITYEVNGHEIPVHMKQKLTPQSQPMFPEYGHDSPVPEATSSRTGHAYNHRRPGTHRATTFYGMSLKDMPEYKVRDTPSLGERRHSARFFEGKSHTNGQQVGDDNTFSSRHRLGNAYRPGMYDSSTPSMQRAADPQSQIEKFSSEYEQANQFGQEDAALGSRFQSASMPHFESDKQVQAPDSSVAGLRAHSLFNRLHNNEGTLSSDEGTSNGDLNERLKEFVNQARHKNQEQLLEELARLKLQKAPSLFEKPSHVEETFQKHPSEPSKFSEKLTPALGANAPVEEFSKAHRVSSFFGKSNSENEESAKSAEVGLTGDNRGIGKEYDGTKLAPDAVQPSKEKEEPKGEDSNKFFEQLERIDEEKQKNERDNPTEKSAEVTLASSVEKIQHFSDDQERTKAKDKLLKILGDLTSKLKGMEAAVKDTHTDERRESPLDSQESKQEAMEHSVAEGSYTESKHKQESSKEESKEQKTGEVEAQMEHSHGEMEHSHGEMEHSHGELEHANAYPESAKYQEERMMEHQEPGYEMEHAHSNGGDQLDVSQDRVSHLINNLKQHNRPFIFNTEEIDYKGPSYEDKSRFSSDSGGEMKDHVHLSKYGSDQPSIERPIISSFYGARDSKPSDELDVHSFHNEVNASPEHEVTPTQRDGGKQRQKDTEKLAESEKKPIVQLHSESESKSDPDDDLPDYNEVKDAAIFEENFIRKKFHAPNLRWSDDLSDEAQKEADDLADENSLDLGKKSVPKGMNVALVPVNSLNVGKDSADLWQKESTKFDFVSPYVSKKNSDFAQMVWKTAKEFGLGVAKARNKENWIVVAKYDTPVVSEFEKLKANIESDIPIADPYSDIARRERILSIKDRN